MSNVPKYREHGRDRMHRMRLGKPHVYWARDIKQWMVATHAECDRDKRSDAFRFCVEQDRRWTPVPV